MERIRVLDNKQVPRVAITGAPGFLAWHTACRLRALFEVEPTMLSRVETEDPTAYDQALVGVDAIMHLAGVNRASSEDAVESGNISAAATLASALERGGRPIDVIFANSIQSLNNTPYGRGKRQAAEILARATARVGGRFTDVLLPNLFGEHGLPSYNSFVATFAHAVAHDVVPKVTKDQEVPLLHAQDAAESLIGALFNEGADSISPKGEPIMVSDVLEALMRFHVRYKDGGIPPLNSKFDVNLFNTYRAHRFPEMFPIEPKAHVDTRGLLVETSRVHGGTGQSFVSTTRPGYRRGDHYHFHKVERFCVVRGEAEIRLRRLLHHDVVTFRLSGDRPAYVDMPTLWVHNILNVGELELVTVFWADQLLDPENPDQFPEQV